MKDFEYAKRRSKRKWYIIHTKNYNWYIWALPIMPLVVILDKYNDWSYSHKVWSDTTATKVLNSVLPHVLDYVEDDDAYYYCMQWGRYPLWEKAPVIYRKWAKKFSYDVQRFIETGYEKEGYVKTVEKDFYETWIKFKKVA